jgi:hypothetical protein
MRFTAPLVLVVAAVASAAAVPVPNGIDGDVNVVVNVSEVLFSGNVLQITRVLES